MPSTQGDNKQLNQKNVNAIAGFALRKSSHQDFNYNVCEFHLEGALEELWDEGYLLGRCGGCW